MTKSIAYTRPVFKGLDRHAVVVVRIDPRNFEIRDRRYGELLATVRSIKGSRGMAYSYKLCSEQRVHKGFTSLKAAVTRVLQKV